MTGFGYDVHKLSPGQTLILGGVKIDSAFGTVAHSDGDVVLHALIDGLFGAAGLRDIGDHFPDSDARYKNIDSRELLRLALLELGQHSWQIGNVDLVLMAERPKLCGQKQRIRSVLSGLLGISEQQVSIKAKTNEGFDAVGQRLAIACHAVVAIFRESRRDYVAANLQHIDA